MELFSADWESISLRMLPLQEGCDPQPVLCSEEQQAYAAIRSPKRRSEWLASRWLIQMLLPDNRILYSDHGKPYLSAFGGGFSISHSSQYAAIAFSPFCDNVAVDVETIASRVCKVRHKFLSLAEQSYCAADDEIFLTVLWCAKEVMFKLMENGSVDFEAHYLVDPFVLASDGELTGTYSPDPTVTISFRMHYQQVGTTMTVVGKLA